MRHKLGKFRAASNWAYSPSPRPFTLAEPMFDREKADRLPRPWRAATGCEWELSVI